MSGLQVWSFRAVIFRDGPACGESCIGGCKDCASGQTRKLKFRLVERVSSAHPLTIFTSDEAKIAPRSRLASRRWLVRPKSANHYARPPFLAKIMYHVHTLISRLA